MIARTRRCCAGGYADLKKGCVREGSRRKGGVPCKNRRPEKTAAGKNHGRKEPPPKGSRHKRGVSCKNRRPEKTTAGKNHGRKEPPPKGSRRETKKAGFFTKPAFYILGIMPHRAPSLPYSQYSQGRSTMSRPRQRIRAKNRRATPPPQAREAY